MRQDVKTKLEQDFQKLDQEDFKIRQGTCKVELGAEKGGGSD